MAQAEPSTNLTQRCIQRDPDAFGELYSLYAGRIFRHIYYMVGSTTESDDLTNETFLLAWKAIHRYEDRGLPIQNWLLTIAHNVATKHLRKQKVRHVPIDGLDFEADGRYSPEAVSDTEADAAVVRAALLSLPDIQRQVIVWRFLEEMSYAEASRLLGKSEGAIRVLQHRALRRLREILTEDAKKRESGVDARPPAKLRVSLAIGRPG